MLCSWSNWHNHFTLGAFRSAGSWTKSRRNVEAIHTYMHYERHTCSKQVIHATYLATALYIDGHRVYQSVCITLSLGLPLFRMHVSEPVALLLLVHTDDVCSGVLPEVLSCIEKEWTSHCYLSCCAWSLPREEVSYIATSRCDCGKIVSNNSIQCICTLQWLKPIPDECQICSNTLGMGMLNIASEM